MVRLLEREDELASLAGAVEEASGGLGSFVLVAVEAGIGKASLIRARPERTRPAVAVIEDAHWADPLTLDLLRMLARRVEAEGILVLVTYRDDEVGAARRTPVSWISVRAGGGTQTE